MAWWREGLVLESRGGGAGSCCGAARARHADSDDDGDYACRADASSTKKSMKVCASIEMPSLGSDAMPMVR